MWGSRDPLLEFWDPLISRGRMKLETSNLAQRWMDGSEYLRKNANLGQKGSRGGHVTHFFGILGPPNISGMNEARNFKFGTETVDGSEYEGKKCKIRSTGHVGVT